MGLIQVRKPPQAVAWGGAAGKVDAGGGMAPEKVSDSSHIGVSVVGEGDERREVGRGREDEMRGVTQGEAGV